MSENEEEEKISLPSKVSGSRIYKRVEYDLYDNAMAVPGSLFAPAYWPQDITPTPSQGWGCLVVLRV
jgi:hypothetical protein